MKRQSRPFTVEVKSRRRSTPSVPAQNDLALIDQPRKPDVLDAGRQPSSPSVNAMSGVFALANSMFTSAASFGDLASSVFGLRRPEPEASPSPASEARSGSADRPARILPSLLPANPLEKVEEQEPKKAKQVKRRATAARKPTTGGKRRPALQSEADAALVVAPVPATASHANAGPETAAIDSVQPASVRSAGKWARSRRPPPRSERWKRRLPAICR
jgi:hypothetical protein